MEKTKARLEFIMGQEMQPCPVCGSWDITAQTPIKMDLTDEDMKDGATLVSKWAKAKLSGNDWLEGPVFMMCCDCGHKGPSVDCSGRRSSDVGKDPKVSREIKDLWNSQAGADHD